MISQEIINSLIMFNNFFLNLSCLIYNVTIDDLSTVCCSLNGPKLIYILTRLWLGFPIPIG